MVEAALVKDLSGVPRMMEVDSTPQSIFSGITPMSVLNFLVESAFVVAAFHIADLAFGGGGITAVKDIALPLAVKTFGTFLNKAVAPFTTDPLLPKMEEKDTTVLSLEYPAKRAWNSLRTAIMPLGVMLAATALGVPGTVGGVAAMTTLAGFGLIAAKLGSIVAISDAIGDVLTGRGKMYDGMER